MALGIDHERISGGSGDHDTVLNGKLVSWKLLKGPLADCDIVDQEGRDIESISVRNLSLLKIVGEVLVVQDVSELSVERSTVRDEGRGLCDVTDKLLLGLLELVGGLDPSDLVVSERVDQLVSLVHLSLGLHGLLHKSIHLGGLGVELSL